MSDGSPIGWLHKPDHIPSTLNFVVGCTPRSDGCKFCFAPNWVARQAHLPGRDGIVERDEEGRLAWTGKVITFPERLAVLPRKKKPHMIFVTALGELFDPQVSDDDLIKLWRTMAETPQHIYVILSKLSKRMHDKVTKMAKLFGILPNVWIGVSVENQDQANIRIPWLLNTPAAIRAVSFEPLLGPVDPTRIAAGDGKWLDAFAGRYGDGAGPYADAPARINWAIVGGESAPKADARPMHPQWARFIVGRAQAAGIATFFKQWGSWGPAPWVVRVPEETIGDPVRLAAAKKESEKAGATHAYAAWAHLHEWDKYEPPHKPWSVERRELSDDTHAPIRYYPHKSAGHLLDGVAVQQWPNIDGPIIEAHREEKAHA